MKLVIVVDKFGVWWLYYLLKLIVFVVDVID